MLGDLGASECTGLGQRKMWRTCRSIRCRAENKKFAPVGVVETFLWVYEHEQRERRWREKWVEAGRVKNRREWKLVGVVWGVRRCFEQDGSGWKK